MNLFPAQGEILYCTGCGTASNVLINNKYHACCPDNNYKPCLHENKVIRTKNVAATCETTILFCTNCNTEINTKTDCI